MPQSKQELTNEIIFFEIITSSPSLPDIILLGSVVFQQLNQVVFVIIVHYICLQGNYMQCVKHAVYFKNLNY